MTKHRKNLVGASVANRLREGHAANPNRNIEQYHHCDLRFMGRHCTVKGRRSGGYVLTVRDKTKYKHGNYPNLERRLAAGWKPDALVRAASHLYTTISQFQTLRRQREHVYLSFERLKLAEALIDKLIADAQKDGRSWSYSDMSAADCEYWQSTIATLAHNLETERN